MNEIVHIEDWHVEQLSSTMQQEDVDAVWAWDHMTPREALDHSVKNSRTTLTWLSEGEVAAVFGYSSPNLLSNIACPWMLGSPLLMEKPRYFLGASRQWVDGLKERFNYMSNVVDARHTRSVRWLKWLGATVHPATPMGAEGLPFHLHEMRN